MSEFPIPFNQNDALDLQKSIEYEDNDSEYVVDGSFIILPVKNSVGLPSGQMNGCTDSGAPEFNLNIFQMGQRQASTNGIQSTELFDFDDATGSTISIVEEKQMEGLSFEGHSVSEPTVCGTLNSVISNVSSFSYDSTSSLEEANTKIIQLLEENKKLKGFLRRLNVKQKTFLDYCKLLENAVRKTKEDAQEQEWDNAGSRSVIETLPAKNEELEHELSTSKRNSPNVAKCAYTYNALTYNISSKYIIVLLVFLILLLFIFILFLMFFHTEEEYACKNELDFESDLYQNLLNAIRNIFE